MFARGNYETGDVMELKVQGIPEYTAAFGLLSHVPALGESQQPNVGAVRGGRQG